MVKRSGRERGVSLVELMVTVAVIGIVFGVGPKIFTSIDHFWRMQKAHYNVQRNARISLDLVNRYLRQASASTVVVSQRDGQPPYSWISFSIDKGDGPALGNYGVYQEYRNLNLMVRGATTTIADDLKYVAFTYPRTDSNGIISVSMTFEDDTYTGYKKALQLSIEKVRVMN